MDYVDFADNSCNSGLAKRSAIAGESRVFDMMGRHVVSRTLPVERGRRKDDVRA